MTQDIYTNTSAFGLMPKEMQEAMKKHYEGGGGIMAYTTMGDTLDWWSLDIPSWHGSAVYRAVRPAPKPMTVPWDAIRPEYICAAKDDGALAYCYSAPPRPDRDMWLGAAAYVRIDHLTGYDPGEVDWKDSLQWAQGVRRRLTPEPQKTESLWAFWSYDRFPYMLAGEVSEQLADGRVKVKNYTGMIFTPVYMASGEAGVRMAREVRRVSNAYRVHEECARNGAGNAAHAHLRSVGFPEGALLRLQRTGWQGSAYEELFAQQIKREAGE